MTPLISMPLGEVLDALASNNPAPGGGSASALAGAAGASLLIMAATLPRTKSGGAAEAADLAAAAVRLRPIRDALAALIDRDRDAYAELLAAYRLPRGTLEEQAIRRDAIVSSMRLATEVPLETLRASRQALRSAVDVARSVARVAGSDVAVGVELLMAAARGAGGSVESNLRALEDAGYVARIDEERRRLEAECVDDAARVREAL